MDESLNARRAQLLVDGELQGTLIRRVVIYWFTALATVTASTAISKMLWGKPLNWKLATELAKLLGPACIIALLPLPFVLRDLLKVTHRFAGPMLRVRRGLNDLAENGKSPPIIARTGDAWPDCIADFNQVAKHLSESQ
jgi:hypothetical protein